MATMTAMMTTAATTSTTTTAAAAAAAARSTRTTTGGNSFTRRHAQLCRQQAGRRNRHMLSVDTEFVIVHTDFMVKCSGTLSVRRGDIIRVHRDGTGHPEWWTGTIVKSYYGSQGTGHFFTVLTEPYTFMDNRIAARIPMALFDSAGNFRHASKKRR
ncbi:hypothetical protein H4R18_002468 [Coemansia javaensis]|uniref:SH3 domain-containing protein n=1 Tax=Coemansia javaensis TaxID=2761396 RepID=A0A9W8LHN7_9FUNG|nr:hypothetical protein H4R18_002468 [Coemansia javaensis]